MRIPPFSKPLRDLLARGEHPISDVYLFLGQQAWEYGKRSTIMRVSRTIVLPPDKHPDVYDWPVIGCDILMIETSPLETDYIETIAQTVFSHGANTVHLISNDLSLTIYKKDF